MEVDARQSSNVGHGEGGSRHDGPRWRRFRDNAPLPSALSVALTRLSPRIPVRDVATGCVLPPRVSCRSMFPLSKPGLLILSKLCVPGVLVRLSLFHIKPAALLIPLMHGTHRPHAPAPSPGAHELPEIQCSCFAIAQHGRP
jgi:hypothetical protein